MLMFDYIKELKTMQSSKFDNYEEIIEGLHADDHENAMFLQQKYH